MNRQDAKSAKKTNNKSPLRFMRVTRSHVRLLSLRNTFSFSLGALGVPVERVLKGILAVKKVSP